MLLALFLRRTLTNTLLVESHLQLAWKGGWLQGGVKALNQLFESSRRTKHTHQEGGGQSFAFQETLWALDSRCSARIVRSEIQ